MPKTAVAVEPVMLSSEASMCGEGRRKHCVPSRTRAITSLTVPPPSSHSPLPSHPHYVTSQGRLLYHRQIRRTAARRSSRTGWGYDGEKQRDLDWNMHRALHRHLEFGSDLDLVLDLINVGKLLFLLSSLSLCDSRPCFTISNDMQIRFARVFIGIGFK
jgi:hypothetical protein